MTTKTPTTSQFTYNSTPTTWSPNGSHHLPTTPISHPQTNLQKLQTMFLEEKHAINGQPYKHSTPQATHPQQKENAQEQFQEIINSLTKCIKQTCMANPPSPLTTRARNQGGFLPIKQEKLWKNQVRIHHSILKAIWATYNHPHASNHPYLVALKSV